MSEREIYPWHLLDPKYERSNEVEFKGRLDICNACEELFKLTKQCKKCGCVMTLKAKLKEAKCPLGKW